MDLTKRVLVVGAKGCGKSALIAQLTKKVATMKTTKLNETYQESKLAAKFTGHTCKLHLLETENEGVHFMAKTSVIMVLFDSRSYKSQQESTKIFRSIQKIPKVVDENIPIIMVFTKCRDNSATEDFEEDSEFHLLSTNSKTKLGIDELKLKIFQQAFQELKKKQSNQTQVFANLTRTVSSAVTSTIKSMRNNEIERESIVISTIPFQLVNLPKERSTNMRSMFSLDKIYTQLGKYCNLPRSASCPA